MIKLKSFFRRGQGTNPSSQANVGSSNKHSHQINNLKNSASASSLDRLGALNNNTDLLSAGGSAGTSRKLTKSKHSSKDRLNELLKSNSKEKLIDEKKEFKKQKKLMQQVPTAAPQQTDIQPQPHPRTVSKEFDITFDGPKEASTGFQEFLNLNRNTKKTF